MSAQLATAVSTNDEMEALSRRLCEEVAAYRFEYSPARRRPHHKAVRSRHAWHVSWIVGGCVYRKPYPGLSSDRIG